jgi:leader peptidase (prepilin peptidase)/N-methyltransferase
MLIDLLKNDLTLLVFITIILGLLVGSFLNVVIYRLPVMLKREWRTDCCNYLQENYNAKIQIDTEKEPAQPFNLVKPDSICPNCGHKIRAWENIPVISYLFLRAKCSNCKTSISFRYPFVELLSAVLSAACAWHFGFSVAGVSAIFLTWALISLAWIDYDTQYLPDQITLPFLWLGLLLNLNNTFTDINSAIIGAVAGYLALWSVHHVFKLVTKKEGMGYGDFKLLALFGAWLGWQYLPQIIILSSLVGSLIGISLIIFKNHQRQTPIPFGPYLAIAGWIALLWGNEINQYYMNWIK